MIRADRSVFFNRETDARDQLDTNFLSGEAQLKAQLSRSQYGDFLLTDAIRPHHKGGVIPVEGFRYLDPNEVPESCYDLKVIRAAVSAEKLFDLFLELTEPLENVVDVILETSHLCDDTSEHTDYLRTGVDRLVLQSKLIEHEHLLLSDGCTGVVVSSLKAGSRGNIRDLVGEIQLDEHKLITICALKIDPFVQILSRNGIPNKPKLIFIDSGHHIHASSEALQLEFETLRGELRALDILPK